MPNMGGVSIGARRSRNMFEIVKYVNLDSIWMTWYTIRINTS